MRQHEFSSCLTRHTLGHLHRGEQRSRAVSLVVVRHCPAPPFFIGWPGCVRSTAWSDGALMNRSSNTTPPSHSLADDDSQQRMSSVNL